MRSLLQILDGEIVTAKIADLAVTAFYDAFLLLRSAGEL